MYTPTVIEMMILEFLSGTNNDRIHYNGIKSSAFFSVIYESEFIRDIIWRDGAHHLFLLERIQRKTLASLILLEPDALTFCKLFCSCTHYIMFIVPTTHTT